jgi:glutamate 5-kinase
MKQGIVPIVNENDAIICQADSGDGSIDLPITDNDAIAAVLAVELGCDLAILLSEVDGVYPSMQDKSPILTLTEESLQKVQVGAKSGAGRGGMDSKMQCATYMKKNGVQVVIASGMKTKEARTILDVVRGENIGTMLDM